MKRNNRKIKPPTAKIAAILKTEYRKNGVSVVLYDFHAPNIYALAFEAEVGGEIFKGVFCNGKLRRRTRRKIVKAALMAFELDYLEEITFGDQKVRGVIFTPKDAEVQNA